MKSRKIKKYCLGVLFIGLWICTPIAFISANESGSVVGQPKDDSSVPSVPVPGKKDTAKNVTPLVAPIPVVEPVTCLTPTSDPASQNDPVSPKNAPVINEPSPVLTKKPNVREVQELVDGVISRMADASLGSKLSESLAYVGRGDYSGMRDLLVNNPGIIDEFISVLDQIANGPQLSDSLRSYANDWLNEANLVKQSLFVSVQYTSAPGPSNPGEEPTGSIVNVIAEEPVAPETSVPVTSVPPRAAAQPEPIVPVEAPAEPETSVPVTSVPPRASAQPEPVVPVEAPAEPETSVPVTPASPQAPTQSEPIVQAQDPVVSGSVPEVQNHSAFELPVQPITSSLPPDRIVPPALLTKQKHVISKQAADNSSDPVIVAVARLYAPIADRISEITQSIEAANHGVADPKTKVSPSTDLLKDFSDKARELILNSLSRVQTNLANGVLSKPLEATAFAAETVPSSLAAGDAVVTRERTVAELYVKNKNKYLAVDSVYIGNDFIYTQRMLHPPANLHPYLKWLLYTRNLTPRMVEKYIATREAVGSIYAQAKVGHGNIRYREKIYGSFLPYAETAVGNYELVKSVSVE